MFYILLTTENTIIEIQTLIKQLQDNKALLIDYDIMLNRIQFLFESISINDIHVLQDILGYSIIFSK